MEKLNAHGFFINSEGVPRQTGPIPGGFLQSLDPFVEYPSTD